MIPEPKPYTSNIQERLIENLNEAEDSILIAMAWFTNNKIKDCLIALKRINPSLIIEIVVDDNMVNNSYFLDYRDKFKEVNIEIKANIKNTFLHHKFVIIDRKKIITGSYNFTNKANKNLENIIVVNSEFISSYYSRIFRFLTTPNFIDENIELLFEYRGFAQSIISSYYKFSREEYNRYKNKIILGECFTVENGFYDEIRYLPGLIFNPKIIYRKESKRKRDDFDFDYDYSPEFKPPISRKTIIEWTQGRNENLILDYYDGREDEYYQINDELEGNTRRVKNYFKKKFDHTFDKEALRTLIKSGVDIIIESDIWSNNFEPFIDKHIIRDLFNQI